MEDFFTSEGMIKAAAEQFGANDLGDPLFRQGLDVLLSSIREDAKIEPVRMFRSSMQFMMLLASRSRIEAIFREHPEIAEQKIEAPIFISGLLRTGTTMLHNVLSRHPNLRAPYLWEMRDPARPAGMNHAAWREQSIGDTQNILELLYQTIPEFATIHPMRADWPDECSWLFRHNFATLVYAFTYHIPSYVEWITQTDMEPYYQYYKKILQLLQWQHPGGRWVVKDPCHLWHLDAILRVFPDARVIFLHRNLEEALPSMASLCFSLHRVESEHSESTQMAPYCYDLAERGLYSMMRLRPVLPNAKIFDIQYKTLVSNPSKTVQEICQQIDAPVDERGLTHMMGWLSENQQHKSGRHQYTPEQFGFRRDEIRARFGRYQERFLPGI